MSVMRLLGLVWFNFRLRELTKSSGTVVRHPVPMVIGMLRDLLIRGTKQLGTDPSLRSSVQDDQKKEHCHPELVEGSLKSRMLR